jgi:dTDP-4-dehydrorhamnose reductase
MKNILFIGGSGQLGSEMINSFTDYSLFNISYKPHQLAKHIPISRELDFNQNSQNI